MSKMKQHSERQSETSEDQYRQALRLAKKGRRRQAGRIIPLLRAATERGHAMAAHALATWYIHGIGVRKNFALAVELEQVAAAARIPDALYNLAFAYETGKGVKRDERRAFELYRRAAKAGDRGAAYEVGRCFFYGIGTRVNRVLGRKWLARSENRGESGERRGGREGGKEEVPRT